MLHRTSDNQKNLEARLESVIISRAASIGEAMARLEQAGTGALALCAEGRELVGLLTDGDVRRAILKSHLLSDACGPIAKRKPITGLHPIVPGEALRLMNRHDINQLPVVDEKGTLRDFILRKELGNENELEPSGKSRLANVVISPHASISDAIALLDKAGTGALILCAQDHILCGLLTDGDIRRAILQGKPMDTPCLAIASQQPVVAPQSITSRKALE